MKSKVWYVDANCKFGYNWVKKISELWEKSGAFKNISEGDRVCIKTHFGASGNTHHIRPFLVRVFVELIKSKGASVVVTESSGLGYFTSGRYGGRCTGPMYLKAANANGFNQGTLGSPIYLLDGYFGTETTYQKIEGDHLTKVPVAIGVKDFDKIIVLSHFKGHGIAGFGGSIKNVGIGMVGKEGKGMMHSEGKMIIHEELCLGDKCEKPCLDICPKECNSVKGKVKISEDVCIVCSMCADACRQMFRDKGSEDIKVLELSWDKSKKNQIQKMVELAKGVLAKVGKEKFTYVNIALDISQHCDCVNISAPLLGRDQGIFVSKDILAIDKACFDLVNSEEGFPMLTGKILEAGLDKFSVAHPIVDPETREKTPNFDHLQQFEHGLKMGLGSIEYDLVNVDIKEKKD
ncbi:MAG: DUF362 domain-containing protein [Candidatus Ranarchaeia archaeon]